jgi:hypothetical protein
MSKPEDNGPDGKPKRYADGVTHDSRGGAVWKWAADSGKHLMESTSQLLKRLDVPGLKLEDDPGGTIKKPGATASPPKPAERNVGYDPYGGKRAGPPAKTPPPAAARPPAAPRPTTTTRSAPPVRPAATKPAAAPPVRRSWWQRLFGRD